MSSQNLTPLEQFFNRIQQSDQEVVSANCLKQLFKAKQPHRKNEKWRHTSLRPFFQSNDWQMAPTTEASSKLNEEQKVLLDKLTNKADEYSLIFIDGQLSEPLSHFPDVQEVGCKIEILDQMQYEINDNAETFELLNQAFRKKSIHIEIKDKCQLKKPLHLIYLDSNRHQYVVHVPYTQLIVGPFAKARLIETFICDITKKEDQTNPITQNALTKIRLQENAQLTHVYNQMGGNQNLYLMNTQVAIDKNGQYQNFTLSMGGRLSRHEISTSLVGPQAETQLYGLYYINNKQQSDHYSIIDHKVEQTQSEQFYKGVLADKSHAVFNGTIKVQKQAQQINSKQLNKNLLLDELAQVHTQPQLEIYADDVKCSHGATIGQLNPDEIFYLTSRGIAPERAKAMLADGYCYDVIMKINDSYLQNKEHELLDFFRTQKEKGAQE